MSNQYSFQGLSNFTPTFNPDSRPIHPKNYCNANYNQSKIRQNNLHLFDYPFQKTFVFKESQWLDSLKKPQTNIHNAVGNTITKPNSSSFAEHKRSKVDSNYQFQQNLAKTVKHSVIPTKKVQPQINPEYFKASSIYNQPPKSIQQNQNIQSRVLKFVSSSKGSNEILQKQSIMSIDQIRQVQKKQFSEKTIHKITSSASRNKLKTSSSKDSKGSSSNAVAKSIRLNGQTERYNKYINNDLININIDLRKEPSNNIISPNLNVRRFGGSEPLQSQYQTGRLENYPPKPVHQISRVVTSSQSHYQQMLPNPNRIGKNSSQNQELTCRDSIPREDKGLPQRIKTRSKSNLSRYSQLKQQKIHPQCLIHCEQKGDLSNTKQIQIVMHQAIQKSLKRQSLPQQKSQKKINLVTYSSVDKNCQPNAQIKPIYNLNYQTETLVHQVSNDSKREEFSKMQKIPIQLTGLKRNQQLKRDRPQTERKSITNFNLYPRSDVEGESNGLSELIEEKMRKRPIRLTLQNHN